MLIVGPNQRNNSLDGITSILGATIVDTLNNSKSLFWDFINSDISYQLDSNIIIVDPPPHGGTSRSVG